MRHSRRVTRPWATIPFVLALGGCFLASSAPSRPDRERVSGPAVYVEGCETCHAAVVTGPYAQSRHVAMGIRCGQCHAPEGHPDFSRPVADGTCGGCHQPQYQQTIRSQHFLTRLERPLNGDRAARARLRQEGFVATTAEGRRFVGDVGSGELGGRLCAGCHYDEHRLGLRGVDRGAFCIGCHGGRETHYPSSAPEDTNRCLACHVSVGKTVQGQPVNTHRFTVPGAEGSGR